MYKTIIKSYIKKLSLQDVIDFSNKYDINLSNDEASLILDYIKNEYETFLYGNPDRIFNDIKLKLDSDKYIKLESLYYEFKDKYKNYL